MTNSPASFNGTIHGRTIELQQDSGLPDGQKVIVTLQALPAAGNLAPGEGLRRAFGACADEAEDLDKYLEWNRQNRKINRPEIEP